MAGSLTREGMIAAKGQVLGASKWFTIDQDRINQFADVTEDWQFIHVDPEKATETMFGGTVAHGMLTLSMLSAMAYDGLPEMEGQSASVNYGFDQVRFISPVRSGSRLRAQFTAAEATMRGGDKLMCRFDVKVEIEGEKRPALTAQWLVLYIY